MLATGRVVPNTSLALKKRLQEAKERERVARGRYWWLAIASLTDRHIESDELAAYQISD